jgi:hypothetical protein
MEFSITNYLKLCCVHASIGPWQVALAPSWCMLSMMEQEQCSVCRAGQLSSEIYKSNHLFIIEIYRASGRAESGSCLHRLCCDVLCDGQ